MLFIDSCKCPRRAEGQALSPPDGPALIFNNYLTVVWRSMLRPKCRRRLRFSDSQPHSSRRQVALPLPLTCPDGRSAPARRKDPCQRVPRPQWLAIKVHKDSDGARGSFDGYAQTKLTKPPKCPSPAGPSLSPTVLVRPSGRARLADDLGHTLPSSVGPVPRPAPTVLRYSLQPIPAGPGWFGRLRSAQPGCVGLLFRSSGRSFPRRVRQHL